MTFFAGPGFLPDFGDRVVGPAPLFAMILAVGGRRNNPPASPIGPLVVAAIEISSASLDGN